MNRYSTVLMAVLVLALVLYVELGVPVEVELISSFRRLRSTLCPQVGVEGPGSHAFLPGASLPWMQSLSAFPSAPGMGPSFLLPFEEHPLHLVGGPGPGSSPFKTGRYSTEERKRRISRYIQKRNERNFKKKIKVRDVGMHSANKLQL